MAKILKLIFIVLLLVTAGEISYYLFTQINKGMISNVNNGAIDRTIKKDSISSNTSSFVSNPEEKLILNKQKNQIFRKMVDLGIITSSIRTDKLSVEILDIKRSPGRVLNYKYDAVVSIKVGKDEKNDYYLAENDLKKTSVVQIRNGKESAISLSDLRAGDKVEIEIKIDLLKPIEDELISLKITKK